MGRDAKEEKAAEAKSEQTNNPIPGATREAIIDSVLAASDQLRKEILANKVTIDHQLKRQNAFRDMRVKAIGQQRFETASRLHRWIRDISKRIAGLNGTNYQRVAGARETSDEILNVVNGSDE